MPTSPEDHEAGSGRLVLAAFLPYRLNVLAQAVAEGLARRYSTVFGIGIPEWRVIASLGEVGETTAKDIGASSRMHKTKVSRAVALLERRGLVRRRSNEEDRRAAFLSLSDDGRRVYEAIVPMALRFESRLTSGLAAEDLAALDRIVVHLLKRSGPLGREPLDAG